MLTFLFDVAFKLKQVRRFELKVNKNVSNELLIDEYKRIEEYLHRLPCRCTSREDRRSALNSTNSIHSTLSEYLSVPQTNLRLNELDVKRRKKVLLHLESLRNWISKEIDFDQNKAYETVKQLNKIGRALQQMANDVRFSSRGQIRRQFVSFVRV